MKQLLSHSKTLAIGAITLSGVFYNSLSAQELKKSERTGKGLYEIVYSEKSNAVYVASAGSRLEPNGFIYKLDPNTLEVLATIDVKEAPAYGLGINQKTNTLYTTNTRSNSVHAIDLNSGKILATIGNGREKSHIRETIVDEEKNLVYVSDVNKEGLVWVIDGKTNTFSHLIEGVGESPTGLALDKERNQLYVLLLGTAEIAVVDLSTNKVVKNYPTQGESAINLVYDAKGDRIFVSHQKSNNVTVLNASTGELISTVPAGDGAIGIQFDSERQLLYVANRKAGNVTVINSKNYEVIKNIETGTHPNTVAINQKTGAAYVTNKAKSVRAKEGEPTPPEDENGDTVSLILP